MKVYASAALGAATRTLDKIERDGREAWQLTATRVYPTDIEDAWDALTNPERLPRWFLPISGDLRVGGRYQLEGNAGGEITRCEPPRVVALTWEMHGDVSWVTVTLTEHGDDTRLVLEHVAHVPEELWSQFGPGGVGVGWDLALMGLRAHFETGAALDPAQAQAWTTTPEGRRFISDCSDAWAQASIAAGTDPDQATASAARVTGFYAPQAPPPGS